MQSSTGTDKKEKSKMGRSIPLDEFWEQDDEKRMDGLMRIERFIRSQGTKSAQIWGAWYDIKQVVKASLKYQWKFCLKWTMQK